MALVQAKGGVRAGVGLLVGVGDVGNVTALDALKAPTPLARTAPTAGENF